VALPRAATQRCSGRRASVGCHGASSAQIKLARSLVAKCLCLCLWGAWMVVRVLFMLDRSGSGCEAVWVKEFKQLSVTCDTSPPPRRECLQRPQHSCFLRARAHVTAHSQHQQQQLCIRARGRTHASAVTRLLLLLLPRHTHATVQAAAELTGAVLPAAAVTRGAATPSTRGSSTGRCVPRVHAHLPRP
jgi:hypothetical protein